MEFERRDLYSLEYALALADIYIRARRETLDPLDEDGEFFELEEDLIVLSNLQRRIQGELNRLNRLDRLEK